ncbi:MAG: hypothetical protein FWG46_05630 [Treponema sp.]|nr:hypothetical protein [Treponema sp.]
MRLTMKTILNNSRCRRFAFSLVLFAVIGPSLWAAPQKHWDKATAEGGEIWQNDYDITPKRKGKYNYIVWARDRAGNQSVSGPTNVYVNHNAGLAVTTVVYPQNGTILRDNIDIMGYASGRFGVSKVMIQLDHGEWEQASGAAYWNKLFDFSEVEDGRHTFTFQAFDEKDVPGPASRIHFILDKTPPAIELVTHNIGDLVAGSVTIKGLATDDNGIESLEYSEDGVNFKRLSGSRHGHNGKSFTVRVNTKNMAAGPHVFYIRATNTTGTSTTRPFMFLVGEIAGSPMIPSIILNTPAEDEIITAPFTISGLAGGGGGISAVFWRFLGPDMESISHGPAGRYAREKAEEYLENPDVPFNRVNTDRGYTVPVDFTMITDGEYVLEVYAADHSGRRSETVSRTIKVSTAAPESRIMYPVITRYNSGAILVQGFSSDANGIEGVSLSMDGGSTWQDVVLHENDHWEIALNTAIYTDGIYSALVRTSDRYGIVTHSNAMINIDNTPPELYLSSPENGQHVGTELHLAGRVSDNIGMKSLVFQIISAENPDYQRSFEIPAELVVFETMSLDGFPLGDYIVRVIATDLADNEMILTRNIVYDAHDESAQIAIFNPLPGEFITGPVNVVGVITGTALPENVMLMMDNSPLGLTAVDRYGVFSYQIPEEMLTSEKPYKIYAYYNSATGRQINSPVHTVYYSPYGPVLMVDSHQDGDAITRRPWMHGRAWVAAPLFETRLSRQQRTDMNLTRVEISYDNGRTFKKTKKPGANEWKFRLETGLLPTGPQPVVIRARFGNGEVAVRRILLNIDTTPPMVATIGPPAKSVHRDNILVYGTASDNFMLADVDMALRPFGKFWYSVPGPIQGMYFDFKGFGATYFDVGLGLSLFDDNVRFQVQYGLAPPDERTAIADSGRYVGHVIGVKLLANIFNMRFDYLFGPDWEFYSVNVALGANFSWFGMNDAMFGGTRSRDPLYMGAILAQFDVASINFQFFKPEWSKFRRYTLYVQPELWFASSDINAEIIFKMSYGLRVNWF